MICLKPSGSRIAISLSILRLIVTLALMSPAMIGAKMFLEGKWTERGVHTCEEFDPDPFMAELGRQGLPWKERFDPVAVP